MILSGVNYIVCSSCNLKISAVQWEEIMLNKMSITTCLMDCACYLTCRIVQTLIWKEIYIFFFFRLIFDQGQLQHVIHIHL